MIKLLQRLENLPVGNFHYKLLIVTGLGWLFDSMDTGLISFVLPMLAKDWNLAPEQVGLIGSIGLFGMAIGAVMAGSLADKFGRKNIFAATVILYSISTGLCAIAWSYESLLVFRFLVGFGLGGELPVAATLVSEFAPAHLRGRFIVLLESFWGLGWLVAALLSYFFIPHFGWKSAFILGAFGFRRSEIIAVTPEDIDGNKIKIRAREDLSIAFQHEIDHLNGILFYDRIDKNKPFYTEYELRLI